MNFPSLFNIAFSMLLKSELTDVDGIFLIVVIVILLLLFSFIEGINLLLKLLYFEFLELLLAL